MSGMRRACRALENRAYPRDSLSIRRGGADKVTRALNIFDMAGPDIWIRSI